MLLKKPLIMLLLSLVAITGCSSKHDMKITEVFRPNILENDAKMFTFSIIFVNPDKSASSGKQETPKKDKGEGRGRSGKKKGEGQGKKGGSSKKDNIEDLMAEELEIRLLDKLEDNNYCRTGYFELDRTFNKSIFTLHGECNESATLSDRNKFPSKTSR
ncbi:hypothetical protein [Colwellia echini]|uniref:Lipoprotein n=1 Tax=Colwellia echini TaxID=1982103 RepID=A0ABY3MX64_9GAMM|nr:hypothetical protein [Colwellia echini]TYK65709.1 hypothetical protein CWS31_008625 [Colwellia echini]